MIVCEWTAEKWGDKQSFAVDVCGQLLLTYKNENIHGMARETVETDKTQEVKRVEKLVGYVPEEDERSQPRAEKIETFVYCCEKGIKHNPGSLIFFRNERFHSILPSI